jgi:integrase
VPSPAHPWKRANKKRKQAHEQPLEPIGLHEARHTYASLMIAAGVGAKAISTYMGHSSITITLDRYGHLFPNALDEDAARLEAYLERANTAVRLCNLPTEVAKRLRVSGSP